MYKPTLFHVEHGRPDAIANVPGGILIDLQGYGELESADAPPRIQQQEDGQKPLLQRQVGVVKDGLDSHAERRIALVAVISVLTE